MIHPSRVLMCANALALLFAVARCAAGASSEAEDAGAPGVDADVDSANERLAPDGAGARPPGRATYDGGAIQPGTDAGQPPDPDGSGSADAGPQGSGSEDASTTAYWIPAEDTTFYWDLTNANGDVNNAVNVGAYDIDGWNNDASEVAALHAMGKKVVCYMDVGTYEPGRPDDASFLSALKGHGVDGWQGEYWLDIRPGGPHYAVLQAIMLARFKQCKAKGFDAVEPDNMDSYENSPGAWSPATTASDQLTYDKWVAETVHSVGLAVFQKNDTDQVEALQPHFDGVLDEECNYYDECGTLAPYTNAHKPVWNAEYTSDSETTSKFCSADVSATIAGALFNLDLDGTTFKPCTTDVGILN